MRSIILGGLVAPFAAPVLFFLGLMLASVIHDGLAIGLQDWQAGALAALVLILPVSYLATWLFGIPYIIWLRSRSRLTATYVCAGAIFFGVVSARVCQWIGSADASRVSNLALGVLLGSGLALCVALAFCAIAGTSIRAKKDASG